jgi:ATP-binding cassette subfamily B protein
MTTTTMDKRTYFWRLMGATPLASSAVFVLNAFYVTVPLLFGLIMREFFDVLSGQANAGWNVWTLVAGFLAVRIGVQLGELGAAGSSAYHYFLVETMLRRNLFRTILAAVGFHPPLSSGEIINRYEEDTAAVSEPIFIATYGTGLFIATAVTLWIMLRINVPLTILAFMPALLSIGLLNWLGKGIEQAHGAARTASEQVSGMLTQLLNGVQALQVAGAEEAAVQRFAQLGDTRQRATVRNEVLNTFVKSLNETTVSLTTGLLLLFAAGLMRNGSFTVGDFALFVTYSGGGTVDEIVHWVGRLLRGLKRAAVSWDRLFALVPLADRDQLVDTGLPHLHGELPTLPVLSKTAADTLHELHIEGLYYQHPDGSRGLADINLTVRRGEFVVITGRIGAGKSLLVQNLLGLLPKSGGTIRWNGELVNDPAAFFVPPRCAYTPQIPRLFSDTVRENILMGLPVTADTLDAALQSAVLDADIAQLEQGLDTVVGPRGVKLSGGQIQRTAAARMFVRNAELLVFDDLSSALDVNTEKLLWERLYGLSIVDFRAPIEEGATTNGPNPKHPSHPARGATSVAEPSKIENRKSKITCLVISHRREALQRADRIVVLKDGMVEDVGKLDELLVRSAEMQRLWQGETQ